MIPPLGASDELILAGDRRLTWAEYGDVDGAAVFYVHGTPSCCLEPWAFSLDTAAAEAGVRLIAPDRPGMGGSTYQPSRRLVDWADDVAALADHLRVERFAVLGYSGGVPFASAVARALPERVSSLALVACVAHLAPGLEEGLHPNGLRLKRLARERPRLARVLMTVGMAMPARAPRLLLRLMRAGLPDVDQAVLEDERVRVGFPAAIRGAFRQGARGPQLDEALMSSAWGFDPAEIRVPTCLWQGTLDTFGATQGMAEYLHAAIPESELHLSAEGHLSVLVNQRAAILASAYR